MAPLERMMVRFPSPAGPRGRVQAAARPAMARANRERAAPRKKEGLFMRKLLGGDMRFGYGNS
jgi:hypothetical protein